MLSSDLPTIDLPSGEVIGAMLAAVATRAGLTASNGEARRLAQGGGLRLNDEAIPDGARLIEASDINADGVIKLAAGKKKLMLVRPI
jgi:tyrosyl-tRNA synthetase